MELPDKIASEAAWAEANSARGPHSLIRQPAMRMFWWRCFGTAEEVAWDVFCTRFPKDLERHISISPLLQSVHDSIAHVRRNTLAAFTSHGFVQHSITLKRSRYDCGTMPACHFCGYLPSIAFDAHGVKHGLRFAIQPQYFTLVSAMCQLNMQVAF